MIKLVGYRTYTDFYEEGTCESCFYTAAYTKGDFIFEDTQTGETVEILNYTDYESDGTGERYPLENIITFADYITSLEISNFKRFDFNKIYWQFMGSDI